MMPTYIVICRVDGIVTVTKFADSPDEAMDAVEPGDIHDSGDIDVIAMSVEGCELDDD